MIEISIVIPCFNEENSIQKTIYDVLNWANEKAIQIEVIVGDNNSQDKSSELAKAAGAKVIPVLAKGYGNVIIESSKHANGQFIIFLDADGQHQIGDLTSIYQSLTEGSDLVIGNRFHAKKRTNSTSFIKEYIGNPVITELGKFLFKSSINDFHSGFRGVKTSVFNSLPLTSPGFELCSELIAKAEVHGYIVKQVPISVTKPHLNRKSNIRPLIDGFKHITCLLDNAMQYRKYIRVSLLLLFINSVILAPLLLFKGMIITSDTFTYDLWSNLLIKDGISGITSNNTYFFSKLFYLFHLLFLSLLKIIFNSHWQVAHFISNILFHLLTGILIFFNSFKLTKHGGASLLSNILFYFSIEFVTITACLLSDTNFIFMLNLLLFVYLYRQSFKNKFIPVLVCLMTITLLYRPTGILAFGSAGLLISYTCLKWKLTNQKMLLFFLTLFIILLAGNAYVLSRGANYLDTMPFHFLASKFQFDLKGIVVWDRYFTSTPFYHHELYAAAFYIQKFLRFFQFVVLDFSEIHMLFNIIFYSIAYFSIVYLLIKKSVLPNGVYLIFIFIFLTSFFHTFTVIDYDWRYRLVLIPFFCNLFAYSLITIYNKNGKPI